MAKSLKPTQYIANFDSATAMLRALSRYLHGKDFSMTGAMPPAVQPVMRPVAMAVNLLPKRIREQVYIWSGYSEAIPPEKLGQVRAEEVSSWMLGQYPRRHYPAAAIGSSNGALVHLWAALGIPWLPQTYLIPVRRSGVPPDEPVRDMEWGREPAQRLLQANPDLKLHHMHDPNQDRLMVQRMTYFRVKRLRLGKAYEQFLTESLPEGATLFVVECGLKWPTTQVSERHIFQFGALGGATPDEYHHGGERVEEYLQRYGSPRNRWEPPGPDGQRPEAEWGFEPALREDLELLARRNGWRIRRLVFQQPEHISPFVADLYRWWYREHRHLQENRLLVESFIQMEPWWALRTGSVPFWMVFNMQPSADALEGYLDSTDPFDYMHLMLFSHGVQSIGLAPIEHWRSILERAQKEGSFVGVDERKFPMDFRALVRYHLEVKQIPTRYPMPPPLTLDQLETFLARDGNRYRVSWK